MLASRLIEEKGIYEAPYQLVREYLLSNEDTATELKQGVWFCKDLFNALQEIRGLEHDEKATSEYEKIAKVKDQEILAQKNIVKENDEISS